MKSASNVEICQKSRSVAEKPLKSLKPLFLRAMKILHGSWIPGSADDFIQTGGFYLWVEVAQPIPQDGYSHINSSQKTRATRIDSPHPGQLGRPELENFLGNFLELEGHRPVQQYFALPTAHDSFAGTRGDRPLPAPELARYLEIELPDRYDELRHWAVDCYEVSELGATNWLDRPFPIVAFLHELHLLALESSHEFQLGTDLQFWYHYSQSFKSVIYKDQYIPSLKYRELVTSTKKTRTKKTGVPPSEFEIYATWEIISQQYEDNLQRYIQHMPLLCAAGSQQNSRTADQRLSMTH